METSVILNLLKKTPVWNNLIKLPERIEKIENEIIEVKKLFERKSETRCPGCGRFTWYVTKSTTFKKHGVASYRKRFYKCSECQYKEDIDIPM